jgi:uncharacterized sporulation protein YeaH/YhbH (DUF444 family)
VPVLTIFNKTDRIKSRDVLRAVSQRYPHAVLISASRGINVHGLETRLTEILDEGFVEETLTIGHDNPRAIARIHELAQILGEELKLPNIEDRGSDKIVTTKIKYTGIHTTGPESLRHFKRTYKQALRRQISLGTYDPNNPVIIPLREDRRYRTYKLENLPQTNAVIIYMMDVSGSMGDEQKEIVRIESFWIDTWLRHQYKGLETRYIIHDAVAREVDRETFFHTRESGGTMISSAYKLARDIIAAEYPASSWNIYPFHFSDGDNWSADDTRLCVDLLKSELLPKVNQFAYGQVESPYGSGQFIKDLREHIGEQQNVALSEIADKDAIFNSIKDFLGKGR